MLTPPATIEAIRQAIRDEINYDRRNYLTPSTFEGRMLAAVLAAITPDADTRTREVAAPVIEQLDDDYNANDALEAHRKLVADLRAVHGTMKCCEAWPCTTIRIIHNAGL